VGRRRGASARAKRAATWGGGRHAAARRGEGGRGAAARRGDGGLKRVKRAIETSEAEDDDVGPLFSSASLGRRK
jgi:hypothetical protein